MEKGEGGGTEQDSLLLAFLTPSLLLATALHCTCTACQCMTMTCHGMYCVYECHATEYSGLSIDPKSPHGEWMAEIGVGRLRLNGLVSLDAPYTTPAGAAVLTTKPLVFKGNTLLMNLDAGGGGSLYVQVYLAPNGGAVTGQPTILLTSNFLVHNGVDLEVAFASGGNWGKGTVNTTGLATLAGKAVVLVLHMQDCKLYGLQFADRKTKS